MTILVSCSTYYFFTIKINSIQVSYIFAQNLGVLFGKNFTFCSYISADKYTWEDKAQCAIKGDLQFYVHLQVVKMCCEYLVCHEMWKK